MSEVKLTVEIDRIPHLRRSFCRFLGKVHAVSRCARSCVEGQLCNGIIQADFLR